MKNREENLGHLYTKLLHTRLIPHEEWRLSG